MFDYENQLEFEVRAAIDVFEAIEPAYVPAWFLAFLAGTWVYLQFLDWIIRPDKKPDPPSNSESDESPP